MTDSPSSPGPRDREGPWAPYRPTADAPWDLRRVVHLHRRAGFAAPWDQVQRDLNDGPESSINRLTRRQGPVRTKRPTRSNRLRLCWPTRRSSSGDPNRLKAWWVWRMLHTPDPLGERLTLMWHNHFATSNLKVKDLAAMRQQNETFRRLARAPFGELLNASLREPALLDLARCPGQPPGASQRKPGPRADGALHDRHRALHRGRRPGSRPAP